MIADSLSRRDKVIQTEWPLHQQPNLQSLAHTNGKLVCYSSKSKLPIYVSPVPNKKAWKIDALNFCWEGLDGYVFCPVAILPQVMQKKRNLPIQDDCTGSKVARDALVLGSGESLEQGTPTAPSLEDTTETTSFQQVPQQCGIPESTRVASRFQESNFGRFSTGVAERIKAPQWETSRKVYQSRWAYPIKVHTHMGLLGPSRFDKTSF